MDDYAYPVRLYTPSYRDINDFLIEGLATRRQPEAHNLTGNAADATVVSLKATFDSAEERDAILARVRGGVTRDREMLFWLLAPEDRFFQFHGHMPQVFIPDPQGDGVKAEGDFSIFVVVFPWADEA